MKFIYWVIKQCNEMNIVVVIEYPTIMTVPHRHPCDGDNNR